MELDLNSGLSGLVITENDVVSSGLDLFKPPQKEISMTHGRTTMIRPISENKEGPFEYVLTSKNNLYLMLTSIRLKVQFKVTRLNGAKLTTTANSEDKVALCNLPGGSLFSQVDISIAGKQLTEITNLHYDYKQYLETICSYSKSARESHLLANRLMMDYEGQFEEFDVENKGWVKRQELIRGSKIVEVMVPIQADFLQNARFYPPGFDLGITLHRQSDDALLQVNDNNKYKIEIVEQLMYARYIDVVPEIHSKIMDRWKKESVLFPISRTDIRTHAIATGSTLISLPNMYQGYLPKHLLVCMLKSANFNKSPATNRYAFEHFNFKSAHVSLNGEQIPSPPYTPDWASGKYLRLYRALFDNLGIATDDVGNAFNLNNFSSGMTMLAFDFSPDLCNRFHLHPTKSGTLALEINFSTALKTGIIVLCVATFDSLVAINYEGDVRVEKNM